MGPHRWINMLQDKWFFTVYFCKCLDGRETGTRDVAGLSVALILFDDVVAGEIEGASIYVILHRARLHILIILDYYYYCSSIIPYTTTCY